MILKLEEVDKKQNTWKFYFEGLIDCDFIRKKYEWSQWINF